MNRIGTGASLLVAFLILGAIASDTAPSLDRFVADSLGGSRPDTTGYLASPESR